MQFKLTNKPSSTIPFNVVNWTNIKNIKSKELNLLDAISPNFTETIWRLIETCIKDDGIGLAGPQVGIFKKIIACREFGDSVQNLLPSFYVYINPNFEPFIKDGKKEMTERCLSVPEKSYIIKRWNKINIHWQELDVEKGKFIEKIKKVTDFEARLLQHEIDHLHGISIPQRFDLQNKPKIVKKKRKK